MAKGVIDVTKAQVVPDTQKIILSFQTHDSVNNNYPLYVKIDNQMSFVCKNDPSEASFKYDIPIEDVVRSGSGTSWNYSVTNEEIDLSMSAFDTDTDILFVYIYSDNGGDPDYLEAVVPVYNNPLLNDKIFNYIKGDLDGCDNKCKSFDNSVTIVNIYNTLMFALSTGDYRTASKAWNKLNNNCESTQSGCNCH